jgi:hypothetical protein
MRVTKRLAAVMVSGVIVSACGGGGTGRSARLVPTTSPVATISPSLTGKAVGLVPAPPGLTDRIVIDARSVSSGKRISAFLIVVNRSSRTVNLNEFNHGCEPSYGVALTNDEIAPQFGFTLPCLARPLSFHPGTSRLRVVVTTTYVSCLPPNGSSVVPTPTCVGPKNDPPGLPPGRYQAVVVGLGLALPPAKPVALTLTKS